MRAATRHRDMLVEHRGRVWRQTDLRHRRRRWRTLFAGHFNRRRHTRTFLYASRAWPGRTSVDAENLYQPTSVALHHPIPTNALHAPACLRRETLRSIYQFLTAVLARMVSYRVQTASTPAGAFSSPSYRASPYHHVSSEISCASHFSTPACTACRRHAAHAKRQCCW